MSSLQRGIVTCYAVLLRFYPRSIRAGFEEEMTGVFLETCLAAAHRSNGDYLRVLLRELSDFPCVLLHAYLDVFRNWLHQWVSCGSPAFFPVNAGSQEERMVVRDELSSMSKQQAVIGAFPPAVLGIGIMLASLIRTDVWYRLPTWQLYLSVGSVLLAGVVVGIGGLMALVKRIPDWGLTWVGCAFMGITLFMQVTISEGVDEGWFSISPIAEIALGLAFFLVGCILLLWTANRGWSQAGVFTIAVAATMGLSLFQSLTAAPFNRDDIALMAGPLGVLFSYLIYVYIRQDDRLRIAVIAGIGVTNVVVVFIAVNAWQSWFESRGTASPLLPLLVILTGLLLSGPLSALVLKPIKRIGGGNRPAGF
jgi:hypothetical protein